MSRLTVLRPAHPTGAHAIVRSGPATASVPVPAPLRPAASSGEGDRGSAPCRRTIEDTGLSVHPLALGCSSFGWSLDGETSRRVLDVHRELGGNLLDTADSYSSGRSETIIGSWMRTRASRDETVIATKIGRNRDNPGLSPASIVRAVDASLERLGTDHIDLLYFHFDDPNVPLEESLGAVANLIDKGKVAHLGASDFSADRLIEARVLAANGLPRFVALETHLNLVHRAPFESSLALVAQAQGLAVFPYFALAHGFLAGRYRGRTDVTSTTRGKRAGQYVNRKNLRVLAVADRIAAEHDVPVATICLAWLIARTGVVAPVAGAGHPDQVEALVAAASIRLGRSDLVELDRVST